MKKIFEYIGIICLFIFSFIFTEKTATVLKEQDEIMIKIKEIAKNYYVEPIKATIVDRTITPGVSGQVVDISASYYKMKKAGLFNETLLVIKNIEPENTILNNQDKFIISGNKNKKEVSLIFLAYDTEKIEPVLDILDKNNISANIFIGTKLLERNNSLINTISKKHLIGNLSNNGNYNNPDFIWMSTIIRKFNDNYCYTENLDENILKICTQNKSYTIVPNLIIRTKPLMNISKGLSNGSIISFYINDDTIKELDMAIKEIKSKGYDIVILPKLFS